MSAKEVCKAEKCEGAVHAKGYCRRHYSSWRKGKLGKPRYTTCNAEGCRKPRTRRGLCVEHFAKEYPGKSKQEAAAGTAPAA